jgi:hypothetical protein
MIAAIAVSATAAVMGRGIGSVVNVTAHRATVRTKQTKPGSLEADLMTIAFDVDRLGPPDHTEYRVGSGQNSV